MIVASTTRRSPKGRVELAVARPLGHGDLGRRCCSCGCAALELGAAPGHTWPQAGLLGLRHDESSPPRVIRRPLQGVGSIDTATGVKQGGLFVGATVSERMMAGLSATARAAEYGHQG